MSRTLKKKRVLLYWTMAKYSSIGFFEKLLYGLFGEDIMKAVFSKYSVDELAIDVKRYYYYDDEKIHHTKDYIFLSHAKEDTTICYKKAYIQSLDKIDLSGCINLSNKLNPIYEDWTINPDKHIKDEWLNMINDIKDKYTNTEIWEVVKATASNRMIERLLKNENALTVYADYINSDELSKLLNTDMKKLIPAIREPNDVEMVILITVDGDVSYIARGFGATSEICDIKEYVDILENDLTKATVNIVNVISFNEDAKVMMDILRDEIYPYKDKLNYLVAKDGEKYIDMLAIITNKNIPEEIRCRLDTYYRKYKEFMKEVINPICLFN